MASSDFEQETNNFRKFYDSEIELLKSASESFRNLIKNCIEDIPLETVVSRVKDKEECISKFVRKYQSNLENGQQEYEIKTYITDLIGIRVICLYETDIKQVKQVIEKNFEVLKITDKISDIEKSDDRFGYKGLHLDLRLDSSRNQLFEYRKFSNYQFEVQVRTIIQDAWSVLDHKLKYKKSIPASLKRKISRLAALFEIADNEFAGIKLETNNLEQDVTLTQEEKKNEVLNVFQFLKIANSEFPGYYFESYKVDGFVAEILLCCSTYKLYQFQEALEQPFDQVKEYRKYQEASFNKLNPYTMIRHTLYLSDKKVFYSILFEMQRNNFENWLKDNTHSHYNTQNNMQ